jgi:hypothetical protein
MDKKHYSRRIDGEYWNYDKSFSSPTRAHEYAVNLRLKGKHVRVLKEAMPHSAITAKIHYYIYWRAN